MRSILSELLRQDRLVIVDSFTLESPKTKDAVQKLKDFELDNVLIILPELDSNITLATRNIPNVATLDVMNLNPVDLVAFEKVLVTVDALSKIEEKLQ